VSAIRSSTLLGAVVADAAERFGDRPAFVASGDAWQLTYRDLQTMSERAAGGLAALGVGPGSVVALVLPSTIDYPTAYVAAAKLGAVTTGINPRLAPDERAAALERAAPDVVLTTAALGGHIDGAVVVEPATDADSLLAELRVTDFEPPSLPADPDRPTAIVFTSGTTGEPKGALFRERQLAAIAAADVGNATDGGGAMIASTQFAHIGFMTKLPWYLRTGTTTFLLDRWRAADVLGLVARERMTTLGAVAPQVALMLRAPEMDTLDVRCVERLIVGAGPSSPALVAEAKERFGAAYSIRYSSTESGGIGLATAFDADDEEALFTVGRPRAGVEIQIWNDDGEPVESGRIGELVLRSPAVMSGYWNAPETTATTLVDGWLRTGDLAHTDHRGLVRLAGRKKEMFIRGGYNVYPLQVEALLGTHPEVSSIAVVPRPDAVMGELGVAVVVSRRPDHPPSLDDLRSFAAGRIASYKLPEAIVIVDELPLTPMGKIDRRGLAEMAKGRAG
jgi:acyl-CoA synthetase (AMP-forming)/AMP-acid ligase II